ncbi:MAG: hypothetical protein J1E83_07320 [Lachnospiraceae bacterium]|nr:hypothetical protein [Lachnospiraceae bacterium]
MRIAFSYNHLHAEEFLYYRKKALIDEIEKCLRDIDANKYLKISCDKANLGLIYYDQKALNTVIKETLTASGWNEYKISYYVTNDERTSKIVVKETDAEVQKKIIKDNGFEPLNSFNQVDFLKERVAVEVQFGKYFSVAYDLHVKHTFFYLRDDIDVGIEIIPTHKMMLCMDTGVAWFENEVTNVIREGRNNPSVPIYILGIESDDHIDTDPCTYTNKELADILSHSDIGKLKSQMKRAKLEDTEKWDRQKKKAQEKVDKIQGEMDQLNDKYLELKKQGLEDSSREIAELINKNEKLQLKRDEAYSKYCEIDENPPARLNRVCKLEEVLQD